MGKMEKNAGGIRGSGGKRKSAVGFTKSNKKKGAKRRNTGPHLNSKHKRELGINEDINLQNSDSDSDGENNFYDYDYKGNVAEEEKSKNRRFDPVDNLEYELPEDFEDEDLPSDDDDNDDINDEDRGNHARMLQNITGIPGESFQAKIWNEPTLIDSMEVNEADAKVSIHDLLDGIHGQKGYSHLRKRVSQMEKKSTTLGAPISKIQKEKVERKVAYEHSKKDITKWEPLVKSNREAPTIYFEENRNIGFSTIGAVASGFQPRTEFEKKMASLVYDPRVVEAHKNDGLSLLELNKISIEDVRERQNNLAKMRSLLFRHELKQKRIKKIKSKTYHRLLKKDKSKSASGEIQLDPEAIQEEALKQEYKRAEERLTLKHKNKSKWAKRNIKRGIKAQDEGTRAAMSEQLHQHALLTRKMNSIRESDSEGSSSSSEDDEDADGDLSPEAEKNAASKLLRRAKEKTTKLMEEMDEIPTSGVMSLPFMVRGLKKKMEVADEEARLALQEYDLSIGDDVSNENMNKEEISNIGPSGGRKVFGESKKHTKKPQKKIVRENILHSSDSEAEFDLDGNIDEEVKENNKGPKLKVTSKFPPGIQKTGQEIDLQNLLGHIKNSKSTNEVSLFVSGSWKKVNDESSLPTNIEKPSGNKSETALPHQGTEQESDSDSDQEMDGQPEYELPSQNELIRDAFAGDDVEMEFEKEKMKILNDENPEPEKPVLLPGWGQWASVQKKKGLPSWMVKEHEDAKMKREAALKKRKDAHLKNVIISEKTVKKSLKLQSKSLPFPFTSKEVFEQSIRMPIGPDYNPSISVGALNKPSVVKESGIIIKPIKFKEVDMKKGI